MSRVGTNLLSLFGTGFLPTTDEALTVIIAAGPTAATTPS